MAARWNKKPQYRSQQNPCSIPTAAFRSASNAPGHRTFLKSRKASPMKRMIIAALLAPALALTAACASLNPQDYSAREARSVEAVQYGSVVSVRPVRINGGDQAPVGTLAGAAVGGLLGSTIGHGGGSAAGAILGAVGGGLAGNAIQRNGTAQNGEEVVVRLDNGQTIAVVQGGWQDFAAGQRVQVVTGRGGSRVEHA
jgi:outer membrane lipoprotein SlyB